MAHALKSVMVTENILISLSNIFTGTKRQTTRSDTGRCNECDYFILSYGLISIAEAEIRYMVCSYQNFDVSICTTSESKAQLEEIETESMV